MEENMVTTYQNSDEVQPRMAAWVQSLGMDVTNANAVRALRSHGSWGFTAFINRVKADARKAGILDIGDRIIDHDAFTEHCWQTARNEACVAFAMSA
jgi:hypothetical protein